MSGRAASELNLMCAAKLGSAPGPSAAELDGGANFGSWVHGTYTPYCSSSAQVLCPLFLHFRPDLS